MNLLAYDRTARQNDSMDARDSRRNDGIGIQANKPDSSPKHADGIQVEKSIPPCERPGYFRLDCEPHQGKFLFRLAEVSFYASISCLLIPFLIPFALLLAGLTWHLARVDLKKMERRLMQPDSEWFTENARAFSRSAFLSLFGTIAWFLPDLASFLITP
jgi:hypothetical protein